MPNNVNREMYNLDVQSITEAPSNGVLATIGGKFSTSAEPSRNDRTYTPDLWRSVVNSERVKEMLQTKTFYGELSHPPRPAEFLSEVQMANVSHNIVKLEFDEESQDLLGTIDILDTPSGKIAHTLIKYGSKIGISSRGIVMDDVKYNANPNEMNPDNYYLVTFDLVALPGITGARLDRVAQEALKLPTNKRLALESLSELKKSLSTAKANNDKQAVSVLEAIVKDIKTDAEMKKDPQIQKAIKELTRRDDSKKDDQSKEVKSLEPDDLIDRDEIEGAVLEKTMESEGVTEGMYQKMRDALDVNEDGTYSLETGKPVAYIDGYQVSFERPDDSYSPAQFDKIVGDLIAETGAKPDLGFFDGKKEISFHVKDLKAAIEIAKRFNQDSIWSWKVGDVIEKENFDVKAVEPLNETKMENKSRRKVKPAKEEDGGAVMTSTANTPAEGANGATQASDIIGPKSTINMIGKKTKKLMESFENIKTIEDVIKYVESMDGVETTPNGKVIINKDTVLFNTMLSMINTLRLRSDANPLMKPGTSIKNINDLDKEYFGTEPVNDEYDQDNKKPEVIKKSVKDEGNPHNASLESALNLAKVQARRVDRLQDSLAATKEQLAKLESENAVLKSKLKSNYDSYNESLLRKDRIIKKLSVQMSEAEHAKKKVATESATTIQSYKALESANIALKESYANLSRDHRVLKDKFDKLTGKTADDRKDSKIRKLIEAQSFIVKNTSEDDDAMRSINESGLNLEGTPLAMSEEERMAKLLNSTIARKK